MILYEGDVVNKQNCLDQEHFDISMYDRCLAPMYLWLSFIFLKPHNVWTDLIGLREAVYFQFLSLSPLTHSCYFLHPLRNVKCTTFTFVWCLSKNKHQIWNWKEKVHSITRRMYFSLIRYLHVNWSLALPLKKAPC